jgi:flagellar hook-associated protein FlgK
VGSRGMSDPGNYTSFQNKEQPIASSQELTEEIIDELQILNDFVNGNSLDEEMAMYAVVDVDIF